MAQVPTRYQCRHIHTAGHRCGSPALRGESFCYFHHETRKPKPEGPDLLSGFHLPLPEDRAAIMLSIGEILQRVSRQALDSKRAGLLLYGLQIAATILPPHKSDPAPTATVDEVIFQDPQGTLAPEHELKQQAAEKSIHEILMERWERYKSGEADEDLAGEALEPQPTVEA